MGTLKSRVPPERCLPAAPLLVHSAVRQGQAPRWLPRPGAGRAPVQQRGTAGRCGKSSAARTGAGRGTQPRQRRAATESHLTHPGGHKLAPIII